MYIRMYICIYVCMCVCTYVHMYVFGDELSLTDNTHHNLSTKRLFNPTTFRPLGVVVVHTTKTV